MPEPPLSPSQQVERIREILVGRQMQQVEERLERLERLWGSSQPAYPSPFPSSETETLREPPGEAADLRDELKGEFALRDRQISKLATALAEAGERFQTTSSELAQHDQLLNHDLRRTLEDLSASLADRVDARAREVLDHLQGEIESLKERLEKDLQRVEELKADRTEVRARFSRVASAAMDEEPSLDPGDGFLP